MVCLIMIEGKAREVRPVSTDTLALLPIANGKRKTEDACSDGFDRVDPNIM